MLLRWVAAAAVSVLVLVGAAAPGDAAPARPVTASAPSAVWFAQDYDITGTARVTGAKQRTVYLWVRSGKTWRQLAQRTTTGAGSYRFRRVAGTEARTLQFQVRVLKSGSLAAGSSAVLAVRFTPVPVRPTRAAPKPKAGLGAFDPPATLPATEPAPLGDRADWTWLMGSENRWNACRVITWAYNSKAGPYDALADLKRTFALVAARSGLRFRYVGPTTSTKRNASVPNPPGTDVVVGWATPKQAPGLTGGDGYGGASGQASVQGPTLLSQGYVVLNRDVVLPKGHTATGPPTWGQIMVHELVHTLGLGHAAGRSQRMAPTSTSANHRFGAGDLAGLSAVGSTRPCLTPWIGVGVS